MTQALTDVPAPTPNDAKFLTGSTMRHVVVMTLTGMVGLMFMFLVDVAALFWVAQLEQEVMVAAIGFAWVLQFAAISVNIGLSITTTAVVSRSVGQGRMALARKQASTAMLIGFVLQSITATLMVLFREPILSYTGAEGETLEAASRFLLISAPSLPLIALGMIAGGTLRALGDAWRSMMTTLVAGLVAMVLDPILIYWMALGSDGAAMVIVISRIAAASTGLFFAAYVRGMIAPIDLGFTRSFLVTFFAVAAPVILTQLSVPAGNFALTILIAEYGDSAVAGFAVVSRIVVLAFGGIFALSSAIGGIFGQNYGAGQRDRLISTYRDALIFCAGYVLAIWAVLILALDPIQTGFNVSGAGIGVVQSFALHATGTFIFVGALYVANSAFNALNRPLWSTGFNWLRDVLLTVPLAMVMASYWQAPGVIYGQALAGVIAGILAFRTGWTYIRRIKFPDQTTDPTEV